MSIEVNIPLTEKEFIELTKGKVVKQTVHSYEAGRPDIVVNVALNDISLARVAVIVFEACKQNRG